MLLCLLQVLIFERHKTLEIQLKYHSSPPSPPSSNSLSKDNIYPELGINHLPAYFCIFTKYVSIPQTFTVPFWPINSQHSAITDNDSPTTTCTTQIRALTVITIGGITKITLVSKTFAWGRSVET